eukprot:1161450-Pelagomonas_calceolata.AAC.3
MLLLLLLLLLLPPDNVLGLTLSHAASSQFGIRTYDIEEDKSDVDHDEILVQDIQASEKSDVSLLQLLQKFQHPVPRLAEGLRFL